MNVEIVGVWNGSNIVDIIRELMRVNQELHVRVSGNKLIIKEININFYICLRPGQSIEIPRELVIYDQEPEEPLPVPPEIVSSEEQVSSRRMIQKQMANQNRISWGLI